MQGKRLKFSMIWIIVETCMLYLTVQYASDL